MKLTVTSAQHSGSEWEVEDANTVPNGFAGAYDDPELVQAATKLSTIADRAILSLVAKTPRSP